MEKFLVITLYFLIGLLIAVKFNQYVHKVDKLYIDEMEAAIIVVTWPFVLFCLFWRKIKKI